MLNPSMKKQILAIKKKTQFHAETGASVSETDKHWDDANN